MKLEWFTDASVFDRMEAEWNALLAQSASDVVFLTHEWQSVWWRNLGRGELRVITLREDDGTLIGIAPLFSEKGDDGLNHLSLVGCVDVSDYLDVIAARGRETRVFNGLLDTLARADFPAWDALHLCTLPAASPTCALLQAAAQTRGLEVEARRHDVAPIIELPATWDEYLATLAKKDRHELRRKLRRIEEAPTKWYALGANDAVDAPTLDFIELHKTSRPDKHLFMDTRMQGFFVEIARALRARGWLLLQFLEIEGARAAALMSFVYNNDVLVYNSGYDPIKYGAFSPGFVLFARSIQDAIQAQRRRYDFLRGSEEYKYRFGAKDTEVLELHIRK
ncbi:MAG: GNAT family N-acetyltransferase [Chloroflexi bacterium]|nr:GNAT family N-acetyltransferase [Chloroflexota bacterium]